MAVFDQKAVASLLIRYSKLPAWDQGYLALDLERGDFSSLERRISHAEQKVERETPKEYRDAEISIVRKPFLKSSRWRCDHFQYEVMATKSKLEELDVLGPISFPEGRKRTAHVIKHGEGDECGWFWSLKAVKGGVWRLIFSGPDRNTTLDAILASPSRERGHLSLVWSA